jgi:hypothetical protein
VVESDPMWTLDLDWLLEVLVDGLGAWDLQRGWLA